MAVVVIVAGVLAWQQWQAPAEEEYNKESVTQQESDLSLGAFVDQVAEDFERKYNH